MSRVAVESLLKLLQGETLFRARKSRYHVAHETVFLFIVHLLVPGKGYGLLFVAVFTFGTGTFQYVEVESHERGAFEAQSLRAVGHRIGKVGAGPVEHGHEVVGNDMDAAAGEVAQAFLVVFDILPEVAGLGLYVFMHGNTLDDRPSQSGLFDDLFAFLNLFDAPHFAVGNVVQGGYNTGGSGLAYVFQADRVVGPVPAPGLFTKYHCRQVKDETWARGSRSPLGQ